MGYYLSIDYPKLGYKGIGIGGKFFGYLDDAEFEDCWSYRYLKREKVEDAELLNVAWSCYSFELTKVQALVFLACYERDVKQYKSVDFTYDIRESRFNLYQMDFKGKVKFSMG